MAQALIRLSGILPLISAVLGGSSLRVGESNRNFALAALAVGIIAFIWSVLIIGYVMIFIGVFSVIS